jgi:hypothetical protein
MMTGAWPSVQHRNDWHDLALEKKVTPVTDDDTLLIGADRPEGQESLPRCGQPSGTVALVRMIDLK